jgi:hypothetical protein
MQALVPDEVRQQPAMAAAVPKIISMGILLDWAK